MIRRILIRLVMKLANGVQGRSVCPAVRAGYRCKRDDPRYGYKCPACSRTGKLYDPDVIPESWYDKD